MELKAQLSEINARVRSNKEAVFSPEIDNYSLLAPSPYDTAWVAMIPDSHEPLKPMFSDCLEWVLNNQNELGFWGDFDHGQECLISTLACIIALKTWKVGDKMINKGLAYLNSKEAHKLVKGDKEQCSISFAIVFPGMVEIALRRFNDVKIELDLSHLFYRRKQILETGLASKYQLLSCIEALPTWYAIDEDTIIAHMDGQDGSLFRSPSATAFAFMSTGNLKSLHYLESLAHRFSNKGVPSSYPIDDDLIKLCVVNHVQRLGLSEYFAVETKEILEQAHKNDKAINGKPVREPCHSPSSIQQHVLKASLAFRLLRIGGYDVSPRKLCMFLYDEDVKKVIEIDYESFVGILLNVHRATDLMFSMETELQEAKGFSRKLLEISVSREARVPNPFRRLIELELDLPWMARLEHLEHRLWIEENKSNILWAGKTSFQRLSKPHNDKLLDLAAKNYQLRQSIYENELEELKRWSKEHGLSNIGFGREKTTYCYFAVASSTSSLPHDSEIRIFVAKSAIVITVADDFFDMKGSNLDELKSLTNAIKRWDRKGLTGHSRVIFDALDDLVSEMAEKLFNVGKGIDIASYLRAIWHETFLSWLIETEWGRSARRPTMEEYVRVGMISIAAHTIVLPALSFLNHTLPPSKLLCCYETTTKLLMIITRLLNDIQSYQKEIDEGKVNSVSLYLENNPEANIEDAVAYVREILNKKRGEFLEHVFMEGLSDLPKNCRLLHLSCLRVFQMFFNSSNRYDSNTEMLEDIAKAIYLPIEYSGLVSKTLPCESKVEPVFYLPPIVSTTKRSTVKCYSHDFEKRPFKSFNITSLSFIQRRTDQSIWRSRDRKPVFNLDCLNLCFI